MNRLQSALFVSLFTLCFATSGAVAQTGPASNPLPAPAGGPPAAKTVASNVQAARLPLVAAPEVNLDAKGKAKCSKAGKAARIHRPIVIRSRLLSFASLQVKGRNASLSNPSRLVFVEKRQVDQAGNRRLVRATWRRGVLLSVKTLPLPAKASRGRHLQRTAVASTPKAP